MALEEFEQDEYTNRNKGFILMKRIMDYGMGILWMCMGIFLAFIKKINPVIAERFERFDNPWFKALGVIFILYGAFRFYRGYKKNYFRER